MTFRIAFSGAAQSGKDLAADYLADKLGGRNLKFSAKLTDVLRDLHNSLGFAYTKDRELMQFVGDWARQRDSHVWVRPIVDVVAANPDTNLYVSDTRYLNEALTLRGMDFVLVKIVRRDLPDPTAAWRNHESETALNNFSEWDYVVDNCGDREHYQGNLEFLLQLIQEGRHKLQPKMTIQIK